MKSIQFKLKDLILLVSIVALTIMLVKTNVELSESKRQLEEQIQQSQATRLELETVTTEFFDYKSKDATFQAFFRQGCQYMDHELYPEAISSFESAVQAKRELHALQKLHECYKQYGKEIPERHRLFQFSSGVAYQNGN